MLSHVIAVTENENDSNDYVQFEFTKMLYILVASLITDVKNTIKLSFRSNFNAETVLNDLFKL